MNDHRFDELTRSLAKPVSRRQVLKALVATTVGGVFLREAGGRALASNSACAHYCNAIFGENTPAQSQCASDAAHGQGLCYTCGPASANGIQSACCGTNQSGFCADYSSTFCCTDCGGRLICSCFTADTLITLADGTSRPIARIEVGDLVIGIQGQINRVIDIERPVLGQRTLYAFNDGEYFVTAEHPFMTESGWKSIDPAALATEGSRLSVDRLGVGDLLLSLAGVAVPAGASMPVAGERVDVRTDALSLRNLAGRSADPMTPLYNLRLDGNHTYFANGLLVHNK